MIAPAPDAQRGPREVGAVLRIVAESLADWRRRRARLLDVWQGGARLDVSVLAPDGDVRVLGLGAALRAQAVAQALALTAHSPPDQVIEREGRPYLERWWLERGGIRSVYVHRWLGDDPDRGLHDHPVDSASLVLAGRYRERWLPRGDMSDDRISTWELAPGDVAYRAARHAHQIYLHGPPPHLTLFVFGPRSRQWGFWVPSGDGTHKTLRRHPSGGATSTPTPTPTPQEATP